jgi:phosphoinositide-3-kinase regulatory subunit
MNNAELLKSRLKALEDSKDQLDENLKQQIAYYRTLEREMCKLKSEVGQLVRQKDRHSVYVSHFDSVFLTPGIHPFKLEDSTV